MRNIYRKNVQILDEMLNAYCQILYRNELISDFSLTMISKARNVLILTSRTFSWQFTLEYLL